MLGWTKERCICQRPKWNEIARISITAPNVISANQKSFTNQFWKASFQDSSPVSS